MATYTKATPGKPTSGKYNAGDVVTDSNDIAWHCVRSGIPGEFIGVVGGSVTGSPRNTTGVGAKNGSTVTAAEYGSGNYHETVLTLTATPVTVTDDAGQGQYGGTGKIYDFPAGHLCILGAIVDGNLTMGATGTFIDTYGSTCALGSVTATTGATLVSTEADILKSFAGTAAVAKVASIKGGPVATQITEAGALWYDGHTTALDAFLNFVITDDATHTSGTGTFTGTVRMIWVNLGDN